LGGGRGEREERKKGKEGGEGKKEEERGEGKRAAERLKPFQSLVYVCFFSLNRGEERGKKGRKREREKGRAG